MKACCDISTRPETISCQILRLLLKSLGKSSFKSEINDELR